MSFSPDAEAEARDSEPEAHVMEPLADDHSSDSDDAPTGIEEVFVVTLFLNSLTMCAAVSEEAASDILVGRSHASGAGLVRDTRAANWSTQPQPGYELGVTSPRSEWGQMTNATAINAVPVLEDVHVGTTQEWSLRLNLTQHARISHVVTHSKH